MITKEKLHRYNLIKDDEIVKEYCKLLDEIFDETNKIKEEHKKMALNIINHLTLEIIILKNHIKI